MQLPVRRPSKIVAVHLNFRSRAEERGRLPEAPSYFLKPPSALAASGDLARPVGTELLGFEGEIALVIGREARRVTPADGWSYVAAVTASNDFGVYDLKAADAGSNVRSKGADGFLPIGPALIPTEGIDPRGLRLRTWLNGEKVQDDSTEDLLFDFGFLIADLSQTMTLEPDDIIVTGTPAGASVAVPGDVVDVEVDVPGTSITSGRLATRVIEGTDGYAIGSQPAVDAALAELAWGANGRKRTDA